MKVRNKKTGEIGEFCCVYANELRVAWTKDDGVWTKQEYNSLAELNEEWEDYEEPEEFWYINECGDVLKYTYDGGCSCPILEAEEIGNRFETEEETEKAVEKLKALTRLKDKGFRFTLAPVVGSLDIIPDKFQIEINADMPAKWFTCDAVQKDLELLFGGEE